MKRDKVSPEQETKDKIRDMYAKTYPNTIFMLTNTLEHQKLRIEELEELVYQLTDDEECRLDHHGYCQTHCYFGRYECPTSKARKLLNKARE